MGKELMLILAYNVGSSIGMVRLQKRLELFDHLSYDLGNMLTMLLDWYLLASTVWHAYTRN